MYLIFIVLFIYTYLLFIVLFIYTCFTIHLCIHYSLFTIYHLLLTIYCLLFTIHIRIHLLFEYVKFTYLDENPYLVEFDETPIFWYPRVAHDE